MQEKKRLLAEQAIEGGMKKGAFKLGLKEMIELFKPGQHDNGGDNFVVEGNPAGVGSVARDTASVMKRKPQIQRQESEIYGRRW